MLQWLEKASYYVFAECADGAYEAFHLEEAYKFSHLRRSRNCQKEAENEHQR